MTDTPLPSISEQAKEISERYGDILNYLIEGVQIINFDHCYLYVNDAAVKQNKFSREELIGYTQMEKYPGIEKTAVFATMRECIQKRTSQSIENEFKFPDGSSGWYEVRSEPISYGALILSLDITQRKTAEDLIRKKTTAETVAITRAKEAERLNDLVIARELKMVELKDTIKNLENDINALKNT